jgi:beta-N-acetylhexosaminidase
LIDVTPDPESKKTDATAQRRPRKLLTRAEILGSDPQRLERLGRHLMVGFEKFSELKPLVEKRAIAGIFVSDGNVRGRTAKAVAKDIRELQDIRRAQGMPPLLVAADQEGGYVSRLSPPLKRQQSLAALISHLKKGDDPEEAVRAYAEKQAHELQRIGITINFAPVVDLKIGGRSRKDGSTHLYWRAISDDPYLVAKVAGWYCDTLASLNIICTLKHFPGLGRVMHDTHVSQGRIKASETKLELSDWVPFRQLMARPGVATMIGHVRISDVDPTTPASYSDAVINGVLRSRWHGDRSLLITDDFSMGAILRSKDGVGGAAVKALNAGIDLVLLRDMEKYYDTVMSALIEADSDGDIDRKRERRSRLRISKYLWINAMVTPQQAQQ